jgi:hypothetical protein
MTWYEFNEYMFDSKNYNNWDVYDDHDLSWGTNELGVGIWESEYEI